MKIKKIISIIMATAILSQVAFAGGMESSVRLKIGQRQVVKVSNGETEEIQLNVSPFVHKSGRTMVPLRAIVEAIGGKVEYRPRNAQSRYDEVTIEDEVNKKTTKLDIGLPFSINGILEGVSIQRNPFENMIVGYSWTWSNGMTEGRQLSTPISEEEYRNLRDGMTPTIINDVTFVPLRSVLETLGYKVSYEPSDKSILVTR